jgi:hypothetical protein
MKQSKRFFWILVFVFTAVLSFSQQKPKQPPWYKPLSLYADLTGHVTWDFNEGAKGGWIDWVYFSSSLNFSHFRFVFADQLRFYDNGIVINYLEQAYLNLFHVFTQSKKVIPKDTRVYLKLGLIKWQPTYTDIVLVSEKYMSEYLSPENTPVIGAGAGIILPLIKKNMLLIQVDDLAGYYLGTTVFTNVVKNAFLQGNLTLYKKLSVHAQAGLADGYSKVFNYGYLEYEPKIEQLYCDFRVGYLPGYESNPWGIGISVRRPFNFVELGAYYQYRFGWDIHNAQIAGFTFRFLKPQKLVEIWNAYNFWYNFYNNTFYFNIPIIRINLGLK